jgi:hypothetical protein
MPRQISKVTTPVAMYMESNVIVFGSLDTVPDMVKVQRKLVNDPFATPICEQNAYGIDAKSGWIFTSKPGNTCRRLFTD